MQKQDNDMEALPVSKDGYYQEPHRHCSTSPDSMWMNDPNGMVYAKGNITCLSVPPYSTVCNFNALVCGEH